MVTLSTDIAVIGAGMVGAATAISLANLGLKVAIVEQTMPKAIEIDDPFDIRVSAISLGSQQFLASLDCWPLLMPERTCVYNRLGVWDQEIAYTEFNAASISQSHLGHIVENRLLQLTLWQKLTKHENITLLCPETVVNFSEHKQGVSLQLESSELNTRIVIAADGGNSKIRRMANIGTTGWNYNQHAMLINVTTELAQQDITWQKFTPSGPVAMLPMPGNNASLVWYNSPEKIQYLSQLNNGQLTEEIHQFFPKRLAGIKVSAKASFPLTRQHANKYVKNRIVLVGDAAHTINPLAGQGVNLGLKDVKGLQQAIASAVGSGEAFDSKTVLLAYEKSRRPDNLLMMTAMDSLYLGFSNDAAPIKLARNAALFFVNKITPVKNKALEYACGI